MHLNGRLEVYCQIHYRLSYLSFLLQMVACIISILEACITNFDCKCSVTSNSYYHYRCYCNSNNQLSFCAPFSQLCYHCKNYRDNVSNMQTKYKLSIFLYYYHDDVNTRKNYDNSYLIVHHDKEDIV
jgi:hypothetical protein